MTVECIGCLNLSRKSTPREFRDLGLLRCARAKFHGEFVSPLVPRECDKFAAEDPEEVEARRAWMASRPR